MALCASRTSTAVLPSSPRVVVLLLPACVLVGGHLPARASVSLGVRQDPARVWSAHPPCSAGVDEHY